MVGGVVDSGMLDAMVVVVVVGGAYDGARFRRGMVS